MNYAEYVNDVADDVKSSVWNFINPRMYDTFESFFYAIDEYKNDIEMLSTDVIIFTDDAIETIGGGVWDAQLLDAMLEISDKKTLPRDPIKWDRLARTAVFDEAYHKGLARAFFD